MRIQIETVVHAQQRYETTGDWWWDPDETLQMRVSALADCRHSVLIAVHELVEALLCKAHGVSTEAVDQWDMGRGKELDEPGDDPRAPYHLEHEFAGCVERLLARELGIDWNDFEDALDALYE